MRSRSSAWRRCSWNWAPAPPLSSARRSMRRFLTVFVNMRPACLRGVALAPRAHPMAADGSALATILRWLGCMLRWRRDRAARAAGAPSLSPHCDRGRDRRIGRGDCPTSRCSRGSVALIASFVTYGTLVTIVCHQCRWRPSAAPDLEPSCRCCDSACPCPARRCSRTCRCRTILIGRYLGAASRRIVRAGARSSAYRCDIC